MPQTAQLQTSSASEPSPLSLSADQAALLGRLVEHAQAQSAALAMKAGETAFRTASLDHAFDTSPLKNLPPIGRFFNTGAPPVQPPAPPLPAQLGPWNTGPIGFDNGVPVSASATLTLFQDGSYAFNGNFHDAGAPSYNGEFAWVVASGSGRAYTFAKSGHMAGTFESGSRDAGWTSQGTNADLAAHWADLTGAYTWRWQATVNWDVNAAVNAAVNALKATGMIISAVIAVVSLV